MILVSFTPTQYTSVGLRCSDPLIIVSLAPSLRTARMSTVVPASPQISPGAVRGLLSMFTPFTCKQKIRACFCFLQIQSLERAFLDFFTSYECRPQRKLSRQSLPFRCDHAHILCFNSAISLAKELGNFLPPLICALHEVQNNFSTEHKQNHPS